MESGGLWEGIELKFMLEAVEDINEWFEGCF